MRFTSFFTSLLAVGSFLAGGVLASPSPALTRRTVPAGNALEVVNAVHDQISAIVAGINATLANINSGSTDADKNAAAQKAGQLLSAIPGTIMQGGANLTDQSSGQQKRQAPGNTTDLIDAVEALVQEVEMIIVVIVQAVGLGPALAPIIALIGPLNVFIFDILAVTVDFLPFLSNIGTLLSGIGSLLQGIGSLIPKPV